MLSILTFDERGLDMILVVKDFVLCVCSLLLLGFRLRVLVLKKPEVVPLIYTNITSASARSHPAGTAITTCTVTIGHDTPRDILGPYEDGPTL